MSKVPMARKPGKTTVQKKPSPAGSLMAKIAGAAMPKAAKPLKKPKR